MKPQASTEEPERQPRKGDNLDRAPGPQEITHRLQRNNSGEREDPAHQNKKTKGAEMQPFKAEKDNPRPVAGEDTMQCERDVAQSNPRTVMPKTEVSVSPPRERGDVENLRHPVYTLAPLPGKSDFLKSR